MIRTLLAGTGWVVLGILPTVGWGGGSPPSPGSSQDAGKRTALVVVQAEAPARAQEPKQNHRPGIVAIHFSPKVPTGSEPILAEVIGWDREGKDLTYAYAWYVNGEILDGVETVALPPLRVKRGDTLKVVVRAYDGHSLSAPKESDTVTVVNGPPVITSNPPEKTTIQDAYVYQAAAQDPEGDAVTFSLKQGPPGMTVNPKTGKVSWALSEKAVGAHDVVLAARDLEGAESTQTFHLTIQSAP